MVTLKFAVNIENKDKTISLIEQSNENGFCLYEQDENTATFGIECTSILNVDSVFNYINNFLESGGVYIVRK